MEEPLASGPEVLPCSDCPAMKVEEYLGSGHGQGISVVVDLDFAIQAGIKVTLSDINYREFQLLRVLAEERQRHEIEQMEKRVNSK